ncbi:hypothetical protein [Caulobacter soli]|uniref:hypothetical protein n=1 Tax=Caulobacter soli TaxID=2708539 RepID=UPI0013EC8E2F|nr:hypothetical protein [Caulobacter soli]
MSKRRKSKGGAWLPAALFVSAVLHAILFMILLRHVVPMPAGDEPQSLQVSLVSPTRPDRAHPHAAARAPSNDRDAPSRIEPRLPILPVSPSSPDGGDVATQGDAQPAMQSSPPLRGLRGCQSSQLTLKEREDCEAQRWAKVAPANPRLNLDLSGRYAKNPEPFLSRRPEKGCRARLTGDVGPLGDDMNTRAGVTCVKAF